MDSKLRDKSRQEVESMAAGLRGEIFELRIKKRFRQLENTNTPRHKRRALAQALTLLQEHDSGRRALTGTAPASESKPAAKPRKLDLKAPKPKEKAKEKQETQAPKGSPAKDKALEGPSRRRGFFERLGLRRKKP